MGTQQLLRKYVAWLFFAGVAGLLGCSGDSGTRIACDDSICPPGMTCNASGVCACPAGVPDCTSPDASHPDASLDGGDVDAGDVDAGTPDDGGAIDGGDVDGGTPETDGGGTDGGDTDAGEQDGGAFDGGTLDGGTLEDGGPPEVVLTGLTVTASASWLDFGESAQLTATGTYSDGSTRDLTSSVLWATGDPSIATVSESGLVQALNTGVATFSATSGAIVGTVTIAVGFVDTVSFSIVPADPSVPAGTNLPMSVLLSLPDGTVRDVTAEVSWTTTDPSVATVDATGLLTGVAQGTTTLIASAAGRSVTAPVTVTPPLMRSLILSPDDVSVARGTTAQLQVTALYSDGSTADVTSQAAWTTDPMGLVRISADGLLLGLNQGSVLVTATVGSLSASMTVMVLPPVIVGVVVTGAQSIPAGTSTALAALAQMSDGTTVDITAQATWLSSNPIVGLVNGGLVQSYVPGALTITASFQGFSGSLDLAVTEPELVSLSVTASSTELPVGRTLPLTCTGTYTDGSTRDLTSQVVWATGNGAVATVSAEGQVHGEAQGSVEIQASLGEHSASIELVVTAPVLQTIEVTPAQSFVVKGLTVTLSASGIYTDGSVRDVTPTVSWSALEVGLVSVASGVVRGVGEGTATVVAALDGVTGTADVTVTPAELVSLSVSPNFQVVALGRTLTFVAAATYTDDSRTDVSADVTWTSSSTDIARFSSSAVLQTVAQGTATVTATLQGKSATATVVVSPPELVGLSITPRDPSVPLGLTQQLTAHTIDTAGGTNDVTTLVTWTSNDLGIALVSASGLVTSRAIGLTTVRAVFGSLSATDTVRVVEPVLTSIVVDPADQSIALGLIGHVTATGVYSDGSTVGLSNSVTWDSSSPLVAVVNSTGQVETVGQGTTLVSATLDGVTGVASVTVDPPVLTFIAISPSPVSLAKGRSQTLTVVGTYTDHSTHNVTQGISWASETGSVASISSAGVVLAVAQGQSLITATVGDLTGSTVVTVTPPFLDALVISPATATLAKGTTLQLTVVGTYSDGTTADRTSTATWSVDNGSLASVSGGFVSAFNQGTVKVKATFGALSATATLTIGPPALVSLALTPANGSVAKGATLTMTVTGTYTDGSTAPVTNATWTSNNSGVASLPSPGVVQGVSPGQASITATVGAISGSTMITVTPPTLVSIALSPANATISKGQSGNMVATGTYTDGSTTDLSATASWASSDAAVASAAAGGYITGIAQGQTTITATVGSVVGSTIVIVAAADLLSLELTPVNPTVALGLSVQFTLMATYSDGTRDVTAIADWSSGNITVAKISGGSLTTVATGFASISATIEGMTASSLVHVVTPQVVSISVSPSPVTLIKGDTRQLTATATYSDGHTANITSSAAWTSSSSSIATVIGGLVTARGVGTGFVTVSSGTVSAQVPVTVTPAELRSLAVTPANASLALGRSLQYTAIGTYSDNTTVDLTSTAVWSSSSPAVATISAVGVAQSAAQGTTTISATVGSISASTALTISPAVIASIQVSPTSLSLPLGTRGELTATGTFTDGSTRDLTALALWQTSDLVTATVSSNGVVQSLALGSATITASWSGASGTASVTVTGPTLQSIAVTPTNPVLQPGYSLSMTATGVYSNGSLVDLTSTATWTSSNLSAATLTNNVVEAGSSGTSVITATVGALSGSTTVSIASLVSLSVAPQNGSARIGGTLQFTATGTFSDGSSRNVSSLVTWSSLDTSIATVSSTGLATGRARGTVTIKATSGTLEATGSLTVTGPTSLTLSPANPRVPVAGTVQLTATAVFSDATTTDVTTAVTWTSSNTSLATVNSSGLVTGVATGTVTITISDGVLTATKNVLVVGVASISVSPSSANVPRGNKQQYSASATYTDGITQDVSSMVTWSVTSTTIATISSSGLVTAVSNGTTTVRAMLGSISGTASVTVGNPTLVRIVVTPLNQTQQPTDCTSTSANVPTREDLQLRATGILSDGSTTDLTLTAAWTSSNTSIGTVTSAGFFHNLSTGTVTITATSQGFSGTITIVAQ